MYNISDPNVLF